MEVPRLKVSSEVSLTEIRSSGVLLGRFRQTTLGFLLGKIPRLGVDLTGQGLSIFKSY